MIKIWKKRYENNLEKGCRTQGEKGGKPKLGEEEPDRRRKKTWNLGKGNPMGRAKRGLSERGEKRRKLDLEK